MVVAAIIACEIGFWVLLGTGLLVRYLLGLRRLGMVLLVGVPVLDVALLMLTVAHLRGGAEPAPAHSLAALYLGFTVAFGASVVRWADAHAWHRLADGPPPPSPAPTGSHDRMREEWRAFGYAALGAAITAAILLGLVALTPSDTRWALLRPLPGVGLALAIWAIGWPGAATFRVYSRRFDPGA